MKRGWILGMAVSGTAGFLVGCESPDAGHLINTPPYAGHTAVAIPRTMPVQYGRSYTPSYTPATAQPAIEQDLGFPTSSLPMDLSYSTLSPVDPVGELQGMGSFYVVPRTGSYQPLPDGTSPADTGARVSEPVPGAAVQGVPGGYGVPNGYSGETVPSTGIGTAPGSAPPVATAPVAGGDPLMAGNNQYVPEYVPHYVPEAPTYLPQPVYVPQPIYIEAPPQVYVEYVPYPFPIYEPVWGFYGGYWHHDRDRDHDHGGKPGGRGGRGGRGGGGPDGPDGRNGRGGRPPVVVIPGPAPTPPARTPGRNDTAGVPRNVLNQGVPPLSVIRGNQSPGNGQRGASAAAPAGAAQSSSTAAPAQATLRPGAPGVNGWITGTPIGPAPQGAGQRAVAPAQGTQLRVPEARAVATPPPNQRMLPGPLMAPAQVPAGAAAPQRQVPVVQRQVAPAAPRPVATPAAPPMPAFQRSVATPVAAPPAAVNAPAKLPSLPRRPQNQVPAVSGPPVPAYVPPAPTYVPPSPPPAPLYSAPRMVETPRAIELPRPAPMPAPVVIQSAPPPRISASPPSPPPAPRISAPPPPVQAPSPPRTEDRSPGQGNFGGKLTRPPGR